MAYCIKCLSCGEETTVPNIVDLINKYTDRAFGDDGGWLQCRHCKALGYVHQQSRTQEGDEDFTRCIKGVVRIKTSKKTFSPYVFFNSEEPSTEISHIHLCYYKDTRPNGGRLKHGHGPGGPPAYWSGMFEELLKKLVKARFLSNDDLIRIAEQSDEN